jgi:flagellar basal-body rod protein FlgF
MDKMLYVAMTGAKETLRAQAANSHNLANANTTGFRADLSAFQSRAVTGPGFASRVYATHSSTGWDDTTGAQISTGRNLDVAIKGKGFIAVADHDGNEAYTRAGDLHIDPSGELMTATGHQVLGDGGPISIPPNQSLSIAPDGTISIVGLGQTPNTTANVARIKLVNAPSASFERGADGLFRASDGSQLSSDASVQLASGALESSNVNAADAMMTMIELSRRFELQVKAMRTVEDDGASSTKLLQTE